MTNLDLTVGCRFCSRPELDRIILETESLFAMLSLGPIVEGYTIIATKDHIDCCASLPLNLLPEFTRLLEAVRSAQVAIYGAHVLYEHGRAGASHPSPDGHAHCYHAHLHCVPVNVALYDLICWHYPQHEFGSWHDLLGWYSQHRTPYLLTGRDDSLVLFEATDLVPRQYLRRLVAAAVGEPQRADWIRYQGREMIAAAKARLIPEVKSQFSQLG